MTSGQDSNVSPLPPPAPPMPVHSPHTSIPSATVLDLSNNNTNITHNEIEEPVSIGGYRVHASALAPASGQRSVPATATLPSTSASHLAIGPAEASLLAAQVAAAAAAGDRMSTSTSSNRNSVESIGPASHGSSEKFSGLHFASWVAMSLPILLTAIVGYIYYVYTVRVCVSFLIERQQRDIQAAIYLAVFNLLIILFFVSYLRSIVRSPGSPWRPPIRNPPPPIPPTTTPYPGLQAKNGPSRDAQHAHHHLAQLTSGGYPSYQATSHSPVLSTAAGPSSSSPSLHKSTLAPAGSLTRHFSASVSPAQESSSTRPSREDHAVISMPTTDYQETILASAGVETPPGSGSSPHLTHNNVSVTASMNSSTAKVGAVAASANNLHTAITATGPSSSEKTIATISISKRDGKPRWCDICKNVKPDRCHHCSECDQCVLRMDHHCPWVNGCVGYDNYKYFFLFIFYGAWLAVWVFCTMVPLVVEMVRMSAQKRSDGSTIDGFEPQWIIITVLSLLLGVLIVTFTGTHLMYILTNRTTIESLQDVRSSYIRVQFTSVPAAQTSASALLLQPPAITALGYSVVKVEAGERLYDQGTKMKNWKSIMGNRWWLWFVPVGNSPGDGIHDVYNDTTYKRLVSDALASARLQQAGGLQGDMGGFGGGATSTASSSEIKLVNDAVLQPAESLYRYHPPRPTSGSAASPAGTSGGRGQTSAIPSPSQHAFAPVTTSGTSTRVPSAKNSSGTLKNKTSSGGLSAGILSPARFLTDFPTDHSPSFMMGSSSGQNSPSVGAGVGASQYFNIPTNNLGPNNGNTNGMHMANTTPSNFAGNHSEVMMLPTETRQRSHTESGLMGSANSNLMNNNFVSGSSTHSHSSMGYINPALALHGYVQYSNMGNGMGATGIPVDSGTGFKMTLEDMTWVGKRSRSSSAGGKSSKNRQQRQARKAEQAAALAAAAETEIPRELTEAEMIASAREEALAASSLGGGRGGGGRRKSTGLLRPHQQLQRRQTLEEVQRSSMASYSP